MCNECGIATGSAVRCDFVGSCFCFQAEDGIRDAQESRGLGDVYKRQQHHLHGGSNRRYATVREAASTAARHLKSSTFHRLSLIHI